jgi:hypothetical protein
MTGINDFDNWTVTEIAYRLPGKEWKFSTPKTKSAYCRKIANLVEAGAEIFLRPSL